MDRPGRNALCPCGSGKKYKQCCLVKEASALPGHGVNVATIIEAAVHSHKGGDVQRAEALYRRALQVEPDNANALHLLGVLAHQSGNHDAAIGLITRAIEQNRDAPDFYNNMGNALRARGYLIEAAASYREALRLKPGYADAYYNLGNVLQQQGDLAAAVVSYRAATRLKIGYAEAHNNLGTALQKQGEYDEAITQYREALRLKPSYAEAYNNLGSAIQARGDAPKAGRYYREALRLNPRYAEAHDNLGAALREQGDVAGAIACYHEALRVDPLHAGAYNNLGHALQEQGRLSEAIVYYREAVCLRPGYAKAHNNLGYALQEQGDLIEAVSQYRVALRARPEYAEAHINLANALQEQSDPTEALAHYREALRLKPELTQAHSSLVHRLQHLCEWSELEPLWEQTARMVLTQPAAIIPPFSFLSVPSSPAEQLACARNWVANRIAPIELSWEGLDVHVARTAKDKLRIGYLSTDFRQHIVSDLIAEILELHDHDHFDIYAYSIGGDDGSAMRQRIAHACDRFTDITADSYVEAARRIHDDGVDILIDLNGHTKGARTQILALRPAPVQVNYMGYAGTMGAEFIDYMVTDCFMTPPEQQPYFTERFVYLPDSAMPPNRTWASAERTPSRAECGLPEDAFVFCCFNNAFKITPAMFDIWMRLLRETPGSVLWLFEANEWAATNLRREADARGVAPERVVFAPRLPLAEHLARQRLADLFLDTLPYNAHSTASNALWAGLPVITCPGDTFVSRVVGSVLHAIGLPELVTSSLEEYEQLALRLAHSPVEVAALKVKLAKNRDTTPLFDTPRYTRNLEGAYRYMWDAYVAASEIGEAVGARSVAMLHVSEVGMP